MVGLLQYTLAEINVVRIECTVILVLIQHLSAAPLCCLVLPADVVTRPALFSYAPSSCDVRVIFLLPVDAFLGGELDELASTILDRSEELLEGPITSLSSLGFTNFAGVQPTSLTLCARTMSSS
jgi:hypothetical protein